MIKYECKRREYWLWWARINAREEENDHDDQIWMQETRVMIWWSSINAREEENDYDDQVWMQETRVVIMMIKYKCKRRGEWLWWSNMNARDESNG